MKILNIYFKNINSLEGENRIHFDQLPLSESGVFAITGPNGSGKSSILDVITLALYGETFRFDRPADHVMTKATTESFAEVEFELAGNSYRSSWYVKRDRNKAQGDLLAPEMTLHHLNDSAQLIEQSTQKVRSRVAEITGMDFHKFSKSMILAQGDFSAYLNALDSERMDILEKISGSDIYHTLKNQAEEKNKVAQTQLQILQQDLNAIPIVDAVSREANELDLADFQQQYLELKQEYQEIHQQLVSVQKVSNLQSQSKTLTHQQKLLDTQLEENQRKLDKIESMQVVKRFEDDLKILDNKLSDTEQSRKTLDSYRSELDLLQKQLNEHEFDVNTASTHNTSLSEQKASIEKIKLKLNALNLALVQENALIQSMNQQAVEYKTTLEEGEVWLQEHAVDQHLLNEFPEFTRLSLLKQTLAEATEKQQVFLNWSKNTSKGLKQSKEHSESLTKKSVDLEAQIKADEQLLETMSEGYSLQQLYEIKLQQQERLEQFQELSDLANVNSKMGNKGFLESLFQSKGADREAYELKQEAEQLQLEIGKEQRIIIILEAAVFNEALLSKMEGDRQHLKEDKACSLCGALDHPYLKYPPAVSNSKQILLEQRKKLKYLNTEASSLVKQIAISKNQVKIDKEKAGKLEVICSQWNSLANKLNVAGMGLDIEKVSAIKELVKEKKSELSILNTLIKKYSKQQAVMVEAKETIELNKNNLARLSKEIKVLTSEINTRPDESAELEQKVSSIQQDVKTLETKITEQLNVLGEKKPSKKIKEDELIRHLNARKQAYNSRKVHAKTLLEQLQSLETKTAESLFKIEQLTKDIEKNTALDQQQELAGLHLSLLEKQRLIADKEVIYGQQEKDSAALKQNLLESSQDLAQGDLNMLREGVELVKDKGYVLQTRLELTQRVNKIGKGIEQSQTELDKEKAMLLTDKKEDGLLPLDKSMKEKLHITKQEIDTLQNKLKQQNIMQEKYDALLQKVTQQKEKVKASEKEIKFISEDNGIHFRHKVLEGMADKLLSESNQVLEKISGRYFLRKAESEHGLALEIEDSKQKNVRRLPKTLSGGESFIVSLALAMGLAEMASNGHALDSLFLDEGFGNLDAEALYVAMTTLESLKIHGKTVGVISHVESVRKRIKTQIKMIKKPNGMSALKVIS
ncbi:MAG: chromosome segregation protein SMC [Methylococcales symbiont of Iophon sp. n. MRB-2018]|nr:MAG: chromosome segregation protein SMC [Methylococcales symbiont of Iophon sp. n. MRB-2018]KAF3979331.1 MAG: chromosome segregation protein SMC [Methylococcales symbiont of Iophon sp. n. MRB-2018]